MKIRLDDLGYLHIEPESNIDAYALRYLFDLEKHDKCETCGNSKSSERFIIHTNCPEEKLTQL